VNRRDCVVAFAAAIGALSTIQARRPKHFRDLRRRPHSRVAIIRAYEYSDKLDQIVFDGLRLFGLNVRGRSVVLKPNLVEYIPNRPVNTDPHVVGAAAEAFLRLGAASVVVAEGAGHNRDTELLLYESGFLDQLQHRDIPFVDLNRDHLVKTKLLANYSGLNQLWLPKTVLQSDFIVSMPKVKTHHWAGVTLSMKNMFGIVPGSRYGWPKNILHWAGIHEAILDTCATVRPDFVIADAIIAMQGDGPLNGTEHRLEALVLSDDSVAADATCVRSMGFTPDQIPHIREAKRFLGHSAERNIQYLS
jgi:uncharacterized protein (DUF362 family)